MRTKEDRRIKVILYTAVDGILTIDEHGIVGSANPAVERLFGYAPAELVGRNISVLMPSPHRERHNEYVARYLRTGEARVIGIGRELDGLRRDGTTFPMELAVSEIKGEGRKSFAGIIRDISARKKAEAELRESRARIQAILDTAVDGIVSIDENGIVESANPAIKGLQNTEMCDGVGDEGIHLHRIRYVNTHRYCLIAGTGAVDHFLCCSPIEIDSYDPASFLKQASHCRRADPAAAACYYIGAWVSPLIGIPPQGLSAVPATGCERPDGVSPTTPIHSGSRWIQSSNSCALFCFVCHARADCRLNRMDRDLSCNQRAPSEPALSSKAVIHIAIS